MSQRIRLVRVTRCEPINVRRLASALVAIAGDLDEKERMRLAAEGRRLLQELESEKAPPKRRRGTAA